MKNQMNLTEAKHILRKCGYTLTLDEAKDSYDYLTESMLLDKIKSKISSIKDTFKHGSTNAKEEAYINAKELSSQVKSSDKLSNTVKKTIMTVLVSIMAGMSLGHGESLGEYFAHQYNDGDYEMYLDNAPVNSKLNNPNEEDLTIDAKHIAVALRNAKINGINIESAYTDGAEEDDRADAVVYNFTDGYSVYIDINDEISILDNGQTVRRYYPNDGSTGAVLEYAFEIAK